MRTAQVRFGKPFVYILLLIFLIPWIATPIPPLVDIYPHAARLFLVGYVFEGDPLWAFFEFDWVFTPNLGFDLIFYAVHWVLPFEPALASAVFITLMLMAAALMALCLTLNGSVTPAAILASAMFFSWPFQMGFLNYTVSVALAFLAFALHQRLRDSAFVLHALVLFPASLVVWAAHVSGWGVLGLLLAGAEIEAVHRAGDRRAALLRSAGRLLFLLPSFLMTIVWIGLFNGETGWSGEGGYDFAQKGMYAATVLRLHWLEVDLALQALIGGLVLIALLSGRFRIAPMARFGLLFLGLAFIALPGEIGTTYHADNRLLMPFGILLLTSLQRAEGRLGAGYWENAAILTGLAAALNVTLAWNTLDARIQNEIRSLDVLPAGARVALVRVGSCGPALSRWSLGRDRSAAITIITEKRGFVNFIWSQSAQNGLAVTHARTEGWNRTVYAWPETCAKASANRQSIQARIATLPEDSFDFVWFTNLDGVSLDLASHFELMSATGHASLYRITPKGSD